MKTLYNTTFMNNNSGVDIYRRREMTELIQNLSGLEFWLIVATMFTMAWLIWPEKQNNTFKFGYEFAKRTFDENHFKQAIFELESCVEYSKDFGEYDDFDKGVEQAIKECISEECDRLNAKEGGDWYFDKPSKSFKDTMTDREVVLL